MSEKISNEYIRSVENLLTKKYNNEKNIMLKDIEVFCEYISSNNDYSYSRNYLRESLIKYKEKLKLLSKKRMKINEFCINLSNTYKSLDDWYLIIDNFYVINPKIELGLLVDYINIPYFEKQFTEFNLFTYDVEYLTIRYIKVESNTTDKDFLIVNEFFEKQKIMSGNIYQKITLLNLVSNSLVLTKNKNGD